MMLQQHPHQHQHPGDGGGAGGGMEGLGACDDRHVVVGRMDLAPQVQGLRMLDEQQEHEQQQRILYGEKGLGDHEHDDMGKGQHPGHVVMYGDRGHENGHDHAHAYGVEMGNGKHGVVDDMDAKLGGLSAVMLRVDGKMEGRDRQMSEGDVGTANSPQMGSQVAKLRGRSSRDPAIEWSEHATTVLLQAFGEKYRALDRGNFTSKIWADIAARVNSRGSLTGNIVDGIPKTQEQCRIKVDNLKKRYKVEREKKRVSGSGTSKWIFYDMMDELIGANPRHMRSGGGMGGEDSPLGLEGGGTPLGIRSSGEEGDRMYYLESAGGDGDQTSETIPKISPIQGRRKRKRALEDLEREHVNAPALMALFEGYNVPPAIIDAMLQEDMDEYTLINSRDITVLLDQLRSKHRLHIKLGPAERIKQAIEAAKEKKSSLALVIQQQQQQQQQQ
ncbi:uncharacterized protein [Physcomitrium patens]|uniref:Myb/SANT-like DNA-binding domain-containing protein n=1 Tax=Physcomitrium patens TaxID=3218 RepID=A0A2K1KCU8_PHYPA|nr:uncharacterized protein LOC112285053 [Physcomitrium patens]XP_024381308.1 uncharacterized protein LOC112285053 [Physcomitrium patens]XP_024381309.1 uncharacterized protein LOC112285053 [Physcomitrium patens]XP_024381310.1 uncharacterized protein LOC112285053 [Physcomitrium patens]XP_024381311.1 uncharacterized protein LOC112285053 [Physcomitrium patens]PNR51602.1 hypothetical protein PHYPA_010789 [Physcomitrium patens]|eukprot:XP_024381307.1 uncharacterized protein LOC112285053 [Physcomitrella patens]